MIYDLELGMAGEQSHTLRKLVAEITEYFPGDEVMNGKTETIMKKC